MKTFFLTVALMTLVGCASGRAPLEARSDAYRSFPIEYVDAELRDRTVVQYEEIRVTEDSAGIWHVTVPIRAATNRTFSVDWRITFFDINGQLLSPPTGWAARTLDARTHEYLTANSLRPGAKKFQLDLRYSK